MRSAGSNKKICVITCYKYPDYVRAISLRSALNSTSGVNLVVIKNSHKGLFRYIEVFWKVLKVRFSKNPDIYILTFRGYEILPALWFVTIGKKFIFDEFINLIEWAVYENKKIKENSFLHKLIYRYYKVLLSLPDKILTDTQIHADYSSKLMNIPIAKYFSVPVSTDEELFRPITKSLGNGKTLFKVFYYSSDGQPLHGLDVVCNSFVEIAKINKNISLTLIGGKEKGRRIAEKAQRKGANITYIPRVPFEEIQKHTEEASLCLGGPFGNTLQASMVITGKTYQFLASAKPCVIGKILDNTTGFKDKENCLLINQGSKQEFIDTVLWAFNNRGGTLEKIGKRGRELYEQEYSNKVVAKRLEDLMSSIF